MSKHHDGYRVLQDDLLIIIFFNAMVPVSLAVPPLRLEEEGSGDTHILNPFCRNVINSLARVITCAAYACYHVLLCVWYLCERKNES